MSDLPPLAPNLPPGYGVTGVGTAEITDASIVNADVSLTAAIARTKLAARTINTQTGTTYTFVLADADSVVTASNAATQAYTIPTNANVAFPTGTEILVHRLGAGVPTITGDTGVTVDGTSAGSVAISTQYDTLVLTKIGTNSWDAVALPSGATVAKATFPCELVIAVSDETTAITTGTAKVTFRMPWAMTLTAVRASLNTVSSSGTPTFDINDGGTTVLSTKLTIDANEETSVTAAAAAVISDSALADDAEITIDIDVAGTGAKGAKIIMFGTRVVA